VLATHTAVFPVLAIMMLAASHQPGEGRFPLHPPALEPTCDCSSDLYKLRDFATEAMLVGIGIVTSEPRTMR